MNYVENIFDKIENLSPEGQQFFDFYKYIPGAPYILAFEGNLKISPASNLELNKIADKLIDKGYTSYMEDFVYERREFIALDACSNDTNDFSVLIYGGGHDFRDNILVWNKVHPDDKYSLIIVKPETYPDYIKKSN